MKPAGEDATDLVTRSDGHQTTAFGAQVLFPPIKLYYSSGVAPDDNDGVTVVDIAEATTSARAASSSPATSTLAPTMHLANRNLGTLIEQCKVPEARDSGGDEMQNGHKYACPRLRAQIHTKMMQRTCSAPMFGAKSAPKSRLSVKF